VIIMSGIELLAIHFTRIRRNVLEGLESVAGTRGQRLRRTSVRLVGPSVERHAFRRDATGGIGICFEWLKHRRDLVVSETFASWNQLVTWLRRVDVISATRPGSFEGDPLSAPGTVD
jgi:hypothetical protein